MFGSRTHDVCDHSVKLQHGGKSTVMTRAYTSIVFACTLLCGASAFEWKTCADTGKADVTHVSLSPDPPQAGDTIKFSIDAESSKPLAARTLQKLEPVVVTGE